MVAKIEIDNRTDRRATVIRIYSSANRFEGVDADVERTKLPPSDRNDGIRIAAQLTSELQAKLDVRQLLKDLPADDPDKTVDPTRGDLFWQDIDGDRYLVGREGVVTVTWGSLLDDDGLETKDPQYQIRWQLVK